MVQPEGPGKLCTNSALDEHDGFQNGNRCVAVHRGEVPLAENSPSLLIVSSPLRVRVNQPFEIRISTRNLVRDFFQPAAQGGYYNNRSFLNEEGIVHGHVHTSVRLLNSSRTAPDPAPVPAFFVATEDGRGSRTPDAFAVARNAFGDQVVDHYLNYAHTEQALFDKVVTDWERSATSNGVEDRSHIGGRAGRRRPVRPAARARSRAGRIAVRAARRRALPELDELCARRHPSSTS